MTGWTRLLRDLGPLVRAHLELDVTRAALRAAVAEIELLRSRLRALERDLARTTADLERARAAQRRGWLS